MKMRKFLAITGILSLTAMSVVPTMAQDAEPTIAEIVVASTQADPAEFTVLLAAVQAADPIVLEALSNPEGTYTVFAPTDAAFVAAFEALGVTAEDVLANPELLTAILFYHVIPGTEFNAEAVVALDGAYAGTLLPDSPLYFSVAEGVAYVNEAAVVTADIQASNGIVHVIDGVLLPEAEEEATEEAMMEEPMMEPVGSLADTVIAASSAEAPEFTVLLAAVQAADPMVVEILSTGGPYTVFAPTDAAFGALLEALGMDAETLLADTDLLNGVLAYHLVPGVFTSAGVVELASMEDGAWLASILPGYYVTLSLDGESVLVNDSTVIEVDVNATNGVIHVIDTVLLPPSEE